MQILVATSNPHKLAEIRAVFAGMEPRDGSPWAFVGLDAIGKPIEEPVEDQPTFEGNAELKARYYSAASRMTTLADDSGLEVDALNGDPGVRSARYAGIEGARSVVDPANNRKLLAALEGVPAEKRSARFVCAMAIVDPQGQLLAAARGTIEGRIIGPGEQPRGGHGFGYDPLFFVPRFDKTLAELTPDQKNAISHRGQATRKIWDALMKRRDLSRS